MDNFIKKEKSPKKSKRSKTSNKLYMSEVHLEKRMKNYMRRRNNKHSLRQLSNNSNTHSKTLEIKINKDKVNKDISNQQKQIKFKQAFFKKALKINTSLHKLTENNIESKEKSLEISRRKLKKINQNKKNFEQMRFKKSEQIRLKNFVMIPKNRKRNSLNINNKNNKIKLNRIKNKINLKTKNTKKTKFRKKKLTIQKMKPKRKSQFINPKFNPKVQSNVRYFIFYILK